jgi:TRAP transporter 4TM/12TM fusion protein
MAEAPVEIPKIEITRYDSLPKPLKPVVIILTIFGIGIFLVYIFSWSIGGFSLTPYMYYYLLYFAFFTCVFLTLPMRKKDRNRLPWYDLILAALVFGIFCYLAVNGREIQRFGWLLSMTTFRVALASIMGLLALEAGRRMAGLPFAVICLFFGLYPLFAEHMPGLLWGISQPFDYTIGSFAFSDKGMLGLPAQVVGGKLFGFLIFAGMLVASGAGRFFLNLATALMGQFRGGPAKVAVLSSGFFGSLTGTPISNIAATGAFTIPAMKRLGYPPHYAGAIEAVASNGGIIMPPVMGTIAFIMAVITDIPYADIVIAAIIPAVLYYFGLLVQVDAYAARVGLKGLPQEQLPSLRKTLKEGWPYIVVLIFLVFGLLYMRWEAKAPVYASGLLFLLSFARRETMMTPKRIVATIATIGGLLTYIMAVLAIIGLLLSGLFLPGSITALTAKIVTMAGVNVVAVLLIAVAVCYVFGMVGIALIAYIVLSVIAVPSLVAATGMSVMAIHFFFIYFLLMANITPPVAIAAFVGAAMAGARPMKTGFTAMRLAVVLYFIPFFFVFNPSLILEGPIVETVYLFALCLVGIWILASGLEAHLFKVGRLEPWARVLLVVSGFLIAFPGYGQILTWWMTSIIGAGLTALVIAAISVRKKAVATKLVTGE